MKLDELVNFVEKFILDIIGVILPGVILLIGLAVTVNPKFLEQQWFWAQLSTTGKWVVLVCVAYVSGHGLHVLGEKILLRVFGYLPGLRKPKGSSHQLQNSSEKTKGPSHQLQSSSEKPKGSSDQLQSSSEFSSFKKVFETTYNMSLSDEHGKSDFHAVRNLAMSVAPEVGPLTYKFMFISLMNLGVATAVFLTGIAFVVIHFAMVHSSLLRFTLVALSLLVLIPYLFLLKRSEFHKRAMLVPFSSAIVKLLKKDNDDQGSLGQSNSSLETLGLQKHLRRPVVYLAGGFVSGWQDTAMTQCPGASYLDPRSHGLKEPHDYTAWDLHAIRESDVVFAVLEATNPGGYALALEVGYAKSRGKYVVLVDEKSAIDPSLASYLAMLHSISDETYHSLGDGVRALVRILNVLKGR